MRKRQHPVLSSLPSLPLSAFVEKGDLEFLSQLFRTARVKRGKTVPPGVFYFLKRGQATMSTQRDGSSAHRSTHEANEWIVIHSVFNDVHFDEVLFPWAPKRSTSNPELEDSRPVRRRTFSSTMEVPKGVSGFLTKLESAFLDKEREREKDKDMPSARQTQAALHGETHLRSRMSSDRRRQTFNALTANKPASISSALICKSDALVYYITRDDLVFFMGRSRSCYLGVKEAIMMNRSLFTELNTLG